MILAGVVVGALLAGHQSEVIEAGCDALSVAQLLADVEALLVILAGVVVGALRLGHQTESLEAVGDAGPVI